MDTSIPFPQADDFEKVIMIINISNPDNLKDTKYLMDYLGGITDRQVAYYRSAAMYLGFINKDKEFTSIGEGIRCLDTYSQKAEFMYAITCDPIMGKAYYIGKLLGEPLSGDDIGDMIHQYYPQYDKPMLHRRGQTAASWIKWIDNQMG